MKFEDVATASAMIRSTSSRKEKISIISDLLRRSQGRETYLLAHYLVGSVPPGRLGIGVS